MCVCVHGREASAARRRAPHTHTPAAGVLPHRLLRLGQAVAGVAQQGRKGVELLLQRALLAVQLEHLGADLQPFQVCDALLQLPVLLQIYRAALLQLRRRGVGKGGGRCGRIQRVVRRGSRRSVGGREGLVHPPRVRLTHAQPGLQLAHAGASQL